MTQIGSELESQSWSWALSQLVEMSSCEILVDIVQILY